MQEMESARSEGQSVATVREDATLVSRAREVSDVSYRAFLGAGDAPRIHWTSPDGLEVVGTEAAVSLEASGDGRFEALRDAAEVVFSNVDFDGPAAARPRMFGGFAFVSDHEPTPPWNGFPSAAFVLPEVSLTRSGETTYLTVTAYGDPDPTSVEARLEEVREGLRDLPKLSPSGGPPGVLRTESTTPRDEWARQVTQAVERIRAGEMQKVVLAQALDVYLKEPVVVSDVLERLRRTYPNCYRFLVEPTDDAGFFGAPPERLVLLEGRHVETEALAGSKPRGDTPEEDAELAASLLESEKLQEEQRYVTDAIRSQLGPYGTVTVGEQGVRKLATIQHLETPIEAELEGDEHVLALVEALHPTPAMGGVPPERAHAYIRETETFDRGWYASPVGWFDAAGDGEFAVGIRAGVTGDERATLFAGNGIVADSDPDEEWEEVQLKYRPILDELR